MKRAGEACVGLERCWIGWGRSLCASRIESITLTLFDGANDVALDLRVLLKHGGDANSSELSSSLATVAVEDCEAAVVAGTVEVVTHHELINTSFQG